MIQFNLKEFQALCLLIVTLMTSGCDETESTESKKEILTYIGITMAKPMIEIARKIENQDNIRIIITQGGSEDLYQNLKSSRQGDLYMSGSGTYRERHLRDGLLGDYVDVGFNQAAMIVKKDNPLNVKNDLHEMLRDDLSVVICDPESGSIGLETKNILTHAGIYQAVYDKSQYLTTDSRNLNKALRNGDADLIINWRATAFFEENKGLFDVIDLPKDVAKPKKLQLSQLRFSIEPEIAQKIMDYTVSPEGQAIFKKHGFLNAQGQ